MERLEIMKTLNAIKDHIKYCIIFLIKCAPLSDQTAAGIPPVKEIRVCKAPRRDSQPGRWIESRGSEDEHKKEMEAEAGGRVKDAGGRREWEWAGQ